jgi:hypothetical protein
MDLMLESILYFNCQMDKFIEVITKDLKVMELEQELAIF